ncbi:hypothetical protein BFW01_g5815 [Lasiodiplodia theobromae]|nr:hypothetical protein BFW01_g5815 [Lasiodiplodia theobromae]
MATESGNTAEEMEQRYEDAPDFYFRFDVDQGLQNVGLDEWKQLGAVKTHTIAYTMETNVNKKIDKVVGKLTGAVSLQTYNLAQLGSS